MADLKKASDLDPSMASTSCNVCMVAGREAYAFQEETAEDSIKAINEHMASHGADEINAATHELANRYEAAAAAAPSLEQAVALKEAAIAMRASVQPA